MIANAKPWRAYPDREEQMIAARTVSDRLNTLADSPGYEELSALIENEIERLRDVLEKEDDPLCRGRIAALRDVLAAPQGITENARQFIYGGDA